MHPRTRKNIERFQLSKEFEKLQGLRILEPLGYIDFIALMSRARIVMSDSGGIQGDTTILSIPCLTLRENTERPVTCELGTNKVVGTDPKTVAEAFDRFWTSPPKGSIPEGWDGKAGERIADALVDTM